MIQTSDFINTFLSGYQLIQERMRQLKFRAKSIDLKSIIAYRLISRSERLRDQYSRLR